MRLTGYLLGIPLGGSIAIHLIFGSRHFLESWPDHAHFHLGQHIAITVGLCVVGLMVIRGPLRQHQRWAWWSLLVTGAFLYGSYWMNLALLGFGEPTLLTNATQGVLAAVYAVGLFVGWREISAGSRMEK